MVFWTRIGLYDVNFKDGGGLEAIEAKDLLSKLTWASAILPGRLCHRQSTIGHPSSCQDTYSAYLQSYPSDPLGTFRSPPKQPQIASSTLSEAATRYLSIFTETVTRRLPTLPKPGQTAPHTPARPVLSSFAQSHTRIGLTYLSFTVRVLHASPHVGGPAPRIHVTSPAG